MTKTHAVLDNPFAANIPKYHLYIGLNGFAVGLILAIWVVFLQRLHGLSLTEVTVIDTAFWITAALGEVPTGVIADTWGRKTSLLIGESLIGLSVLAWSISSSVPALLIIYVIMSLGFTCLSGAQDALLYESVKISGRDGQYARIVGRVEALRLAAAALGMVTSGLLATIDLRLPLIISGLIYLVNLGVIFTLREPIHAEAQVARKHYRDSVRDAVRIVRAQPTLRYALFYLTVMPWASFIVEIVFLQPQALSLGVPIAGIGVVAMSVQWANVLGSTQSSRVGGQFGERRVLYFAPILSVIALILLARFQILPTLLLIAVLGFLTTILRPIVLRVIQKQVTDDVRATVLSMQSLTLTGLLVFTEPALGFIADQSGLPTAYLVMAGVSSLFIAFLFWKGRSHFPQPAQQTRRADCRGGSPCPPLPLH